METTEKKEAMAAEIKKAVARCNQLYIEARDLGLETTFNTSYSRLCITDTPLSVSVREVKEF